MKILVTGSAGHLGEALLQSLAAEPAQAYELIGLDVVESPYTTVVGSVADAALVAECMQGVSTVFHTATLHKPHVGTHSKSQFVETNIQGTLTLLEAAVAAKVEQFIFTSTTSTFGNALRPPLTSPAAWITEDVVPVPKNIYGITKLAAEELCALFHRQFGLACLVLRTSRFFPEDDDDADKRALFASDNTKVNELLYRRVDIQDCVDAHLLAAQKAQRIGFEKFIISATPPFKPEDLSTLRTQMPNVVEKYVPKYKALYKKLGWHMFAEADRVYVNDRARQQLGWQPVYTFKYALAQLASGQDWRSPLTHKIGVKGYHDEVFEDGPYPLE